ncbi:MAG TPA: sigma-70 family RNA polymerase sigma factor [Ktedonobacterales bacterium]|nr:sigma-70 family RNA polymerase sigma factor [Ktedonobacterales bacterium]
MDINGTALAAGKALGRAITGRTHEENATATPSPRTTDMIEDTTLVRRTLSGDQEAFSSLVEKYKDPVFNVAYRMLGNPTEAEDVAQEAFVRAYTQLHTYKETHRFSTWLLSIASHLSIDQLRRRRFLALPLENVPFLEWIADVGPGPEQSALRHETADDMQRILDTLPVKYRAVLLLRYWHDFSYEEIAQTLELTPALVKARLHRARELVARTMKAQGLDMTLVSEETEEREHGKIAAGDVGLAAH